MAEEFVIKLEDDSDDPSKGGSQGAASGRSAKVIKDELELEKRIIHQKRIALQEDIRNQARLAKATRKRERELEKHQIFKEFEPRLRDAKGLEEKQAIKDERKAKDLASRKRMDEDLSAMSKKFGTMGKNATRESAQQIHDTTTNFANSIQEATTNQRKRESELNKQVTAINHAKVKSMKEDAAAIKKAEDDRQAAIGEQVKAINKAKRGSIRDDQRESDKLASEADRAQQWKADALYRGGVKAQKDDEKEAERQAKLQEKALSDRATRGARARARTGREFEQGVERQEAERARQQRAATLIGRAVFVGVTRAIGGQAAGRGALISQALGAGADRTTGALSALLGAASRITAVGAVAAGLVTLPDRMQKALRAASESFGGPSRQMIEGMSPQAAIARARQQQAATFGALDAARTSGAAMGRRIEAETKMATALSTAQARLFAATEPIWTTVLNAGAGVVEFVAGKPGGSAAADIDHFHPGLKAMSALGAMFTLAARAEFAKHEKLSLERWAEMMRRRENKQDATVLGLLPFDKSLLEPWQFPEFKNGVPDPERPGFMQPPVWMAPGQLGFN